MSINKSIPIYSPITGFVNAFKEIEGDLYSNLISGQGIAIEPKQGRLISPINGTITSIAEFKNSICILADSGVELLIHIGVDTIELKGKHYSCYVSEGEKVEIGKLLIEFDKVGICLDGYPVITSIIISNADMYKAIIPMAKDDINENELLLEIEIL